MKGAIFFFFFFFFFTNKSSLYSSLALLYICLTAAPLLFALHSVYPAPLHLLDSHLTQLLDEHLFAPAPACGAQLLSRGGGAAPAQLLDLLFGGRVHLGAQLIWAFVEVDHKISQPQNFAATKFPNNKKDRDLPCRYYICHRSGFFSRVLFLFFYL